MPHVTIHSMDSSKLVTTPQKKRGCLKGCLIFVVALLLLIGGVVALTLRLPQKLGLIKSPAQKLFDDTPDRTSAKTITAALQKSGLAVKGLDVYVLPLKDGSGSTAVVVLDASAGFQFTGTQNGDPFLGTLATIAKTQLGKNVNLKRVALDYKDETGATLLDVTAPTSSILDFTNGKISKEVFMKSIDGRLDIKNTINRYQRNPLF